MRRRHPPFPRLWLMTDERIGEALWRAVERLPPGSGLVFRHYATPRAERARLWSRLERIARRRRLVLVHAGESPGRGGGGVHNRRGKGLFTASAHNRREALAKVKDGAELLFVSPVFATRSHRGARPLGRLRFALMIRGIGVPVIALGGMDASRAKSLRGIGIHGWAGIDAWL
jgi:thiamine-phosphate pyrophosphorylase